MKNGATTVELLPLSKIVPAKDNPRRKVGDVGELADSIKAIGLLEPLVVMPQNGNYLLVCGERRLAGAKKAGIKEVPAIVREFDDRERIEAMLIENLQREDLDPLEEAEAFSRLVVFGHSQRELAKRLGRSQSHISKRLALLELPDRVLKLLDSGGITIGGALALTPLTEEPEALDAVLEDIEYEPGATEDDVGHYVNMEVRRLETQRQLQAQRKKLEDAGTTVVELEDYRTPKGMIEIRKGGGWDTLNLDPAAHAKEPCHVAGIRHGQVVNLCSDRKRHPKAKTQSESSNSRHGSANARWREHDKELAKARTARREFAGELLTSKLPKAEVVEQIVSGIIREAQQEGRKVACQLLGLEPKESTGHYGGPDYTATLAEFAASGEQALLRVGLAIALAGQEQHLGSGYYYGGFDRQSSYFEFLKRHGYEMSEAEQLELDGKGPRR